jgi:hypothetical protein
LHVEELVPSFTKLFNTNLEEEVEVEYHLPSAKIRF